MKLIELINENCAKGAMREELDKALHVHHKPFSRNDQEIPFNKLEKLVCKYMEKYSVCIQWIRTSARDGMVWYTAEVASREPYKALYSITAGSMYELYAKVSLAMKLAVQEGKVRTWEEIDSERWKKLTDYKLPDGARKSREPKNSPTNKPMGKKGGIYEELSAFR